MRAQVERFVHAAQTLLADQLVGVYLCEGHVFSKDEGGEWALRVLRGQHRSVVTAALEVYWGDRGEGNFAPAALDAFAAYMRGEIAASLRQLPRLSFEY